ncbi:MAG TPA: TIGR00730 family Rossman fold protein [Actinomycetota bacterium]|nr:TIGR00730 family Rossman fold protein [Actinomycetota bacterium]
MKRVCVFCGSNHGVDGVYAAAARDLGRTVADAGLGVVYGGGRVGLMGEVAAAALDAGGQVTGVIPEALLAREIGWDDLGDLRVVDSMHERKALMADLSDAFIALPGGFGTLEEFFETLTWSQLGLHDKALGLLDVAGYYEPLLRFFDHAVTEGFVREEHRDIVVVGTDPRELLSRLERWRPPATEKWIGDRDL